MFPDLSGFFRTSPGFFRIFQGFSGHLRTSPEFSGLRTSFSESIEPGYPEYITRACLKGGRVNLTISTQSMALEQRDPRTNNLLTLLGTRTNNLVALHDPRAINLLTIFRP